MALVRLRRLLESSWYGNRGPLLALVPFAWLYGLIVRSRRWGYTAELIKAPALPLPVIVVGNISVGGTGKTPVCVWLAQELQARGFRPGIVSRGYGGRVHRQPSMVQTEDTQLFGDEPVLLARQTRCPVCVCVDRPAAVRRLTAEEVDVVISDDGLQHYRMPRVLEIVVVDGERGFGNGRLLPAGPLREPVSRALDAAAIVVNGPVDKVPGFQFHLAASDLLAVGAEAKRAISSFAGQRVWAVAGIGNPGRFYRELRSAGIEVDEVDVADHGVIDLNELRLLRLQPVLMTEKDAVKYEQQDCPDCWYLPVRAVFESDAAASLMAVVEEALRSGRK